jgi:hypothetical protein
VFARDSLSKINAAVTAAKVSSSKQSMLLTNHSRRTV